MAWFGDGLPSLSNLKGQLTNFTKEVLSEGIVEEIDERSKALTEANEKCVELQEILNSKDAEISLLRRQNCELQKAVVELNAKPKDSTDSNQDGESEAFFWDPPSGKNRISNNQNHGRQLQEQLAQATVKIRELEAELKRVQKVNNSALKEELMDGPQKAEFLRTKQDMVNRIIQMEEKSREAERNTRRVQFDETAWVNDFRTVLSTLNPLEKLDIVRSTLKALETENEKYSEANEQEKSDFDEKFKTMNHGNVDHETVALKSNFEMNSENHKRHDGLIDVSSNRQSELYKKIEELQEENKRLFANIEELDQQHEESIEKLLSLKDEIEKKHQCLQNAYEQLYVDYNQAQDKIAQLEDKLTSSTSPPHPKIISSSVQTENCQSTDKHVQTPDSNAENIEEKIKNITIDELTEKVKDILKNTSLETKSNESIIETVAKQYVDAKWKKDVLEKRVMEVTRELKSAVEMKDNFEKERDVLQSRVDTLLLDITDLKESCQPISKSSEKRVVSLQSEIETLQEEMKFLLTENCTLRKEVAILSGEDSNEMRLDSPESSGISNRSRKLTTLEEIPEDIEDIDGSADSLNKKPRATFYENGELRRKIDVLESSQRELEEQLRISLEKCETLDENIEYAKKLKLDFENVRWKLKTTTSNEKRLENNLASLRDTKNMIEMENEKLSQKNEQLEAEILKWQECIAETQNNESLKSLQEQLNKTMREKNELEFEVVNVKQELEKAMSQVDLKESSIARLSQEKSSLIEQLTAIQDESNDKIDLVNTEKSLLEQEQTELNEKVEDNEKELIKIGERLRETEEKYSELANEYVTVSERAEELELENENLHNEMKKREESANEHIRLTEKLDSMEGEYAQLLTKVEALRLKERELEKLQESFSKLSGENATLMNEYKVLQDSMKNLEYDVTRLQEEKEELLSRIEENGSDNERQQTAALLEEKTRENDTLRADNGKLMSEIANSQMKLENSIDSNTNWYHMAKETIESLSRLVRDKDEEIKNLKQDLDLAKTNAEVSDQFATVKNERDELVKLVTTKHNESLQYHAEIQRLTRLLNEQTSQLQSLLAEKDTNLSELKEKDAQILWTKNELLAAQQRLKNIEESSSQETCRIVEHSTQTSEIAVLNEKCNALEAALVQEQSNNRMLQNQFGESQSKEANAAKELERLRAHLVEMESSYTEEALLSEEIRKELEAKLQQAEEKMKNSSTAYTSANIRANQQVETLQQQMALIVQQRDDIQNKLSIAEDKILSQNASLTNLQIVLEQFQRDKEKDIIAATERIQFKLNESYKKQEEFANDVANLKEQLAEARECLQAASRLSEQLDRKAERIEQLTQEVDRLTNLVNTADHRIEEAKQSGEGKVDKTLIKNLLLGYLSSSAGDKSSVLRVFSTVLEFTEAEKDKAGLNNAAAQNSWFSRLSGGSAVPNKDQEASLSAAFVKFLENESKPKPQLPGLPIQTSPLPRPGHSRQHSTSSTQSTLLLSNVNLPTFPDFIPARNTGSILKEVLKDS